MPKKAKQVKEVTQEEIDVEKYRITADTALADALRARSEQAAEHERVHELMKVSMLLGVRSQLCYSLVSFSCLEQHLFRQLRRGVMFNHDHQNKKALLR